MKSQWTNSAGIFDMSDESLKDYLLDGARSGYRRPRTFAEGAEDGAEDYLARKLAAFTTPADHVNFDNN